MAVVKAEAYDQLYEEMDTAEGMKKVLKMAKQRARNSRDICQPTLILRRETCWGKMTKSWRDGRRVSRDL